MDFIQLLIVTEASVAVDVTPTPAPIVDTVVML